MAQEHGQMYIFFLLLRILLVSGSVDFFELNNAQYELNIDTSPLAFDEIPDDNDTLITLANKHGQKFVCSLPERPTPMEKDLSSGTSVNPMVASDKISKNLVKCIKLKSGWWTYILCPRKSITQSHGKEGDKDFVSNSLGMFTGKYSMPSFSSSSEGEKMLYLEERYDMGAVCDVTGTPRSAVVHYTCEPLYSDKDAMIYAVDEEASCEYKVEVRTGALCSIPQFQPPKPPQTQPIHCAPVLSVEAALKLEKGEAIKKINKEKATRELAAIKAEYEETMVRRWSIERRRMEINQESFDLKMRDLDEEYIDMTRDQLEWNIIAKTGEEPTAETKETIHDLLDNMEAIETSQVFYDSVAAEDRANLWYYFHNRKWRSDGFPLLLDEVDLRNGFVAHVNEILSTERLNEKQRDRLKRIVEFGHPSRLDAVLVYMGAKQFKLSLTHSLSAAIRRSIPIGTSISDDNVMKITIRDLERLIRESNRHSTNRPSIDSLLDVFSIVWALGKFRKNIDEINPIREDLIRNDRIGLEAIVVAETIDRILHAWEFFDFELTGHGIRASAIDAKVKKSEYNEDLDRVRRAGGDFSSYFELIERNRDPEDRRGTLLDLVKKIEFGGFSSIEFVKSFHWDFVRSSLIQKARMNLPTSSPVSRLVNEYGQDSAVAVFRDNIDARAVMEQLEHAGLGSDTVKLQIHLKDGQTLSAEDDKIIKELIERELKEARIREKAKQRNRAYEYVFKDYNFNIL